jgi:hypothetical protein
MIMKTALKFSALIFAPVLIAFLLPALFLLPSGVSFTLIALFDPTVTISDAISYDMWIIGPVLAALGFFMVGLGLNSLHLRSNSSRSAWLATWAVFTIALFFAVWIGIIIITSIGASETPPHVFLKMTAIIATGLTLLGQILVIPWFIIVSRLMPASETRDTVYRE